MVFYVNKKKMLFLKTYFTKVSYVCGISLKKHILVDLEQFENEIQIPPPPYAASNYF